MRLYIETYYNHKIRTSNLASFHNRILSCIEMRPTCIRANSAHVCGFTRDRILSFLETCYPGGYPLRAFNGRDF